jgi:hypothetical protein
LIFNKAKFLDDFIKHKVPEGPEKATRGG